ncbi:SAV_915 family protein [Streptomyces sp. NPDC058867]|uniref:SAV_915 family protein n=1 Tax=unclassified Streptomyces TaxID=2593676 RepID=UPI0036A2A0D0
MDTPEFLVLPTMGEAAHTPDGSPPKGSMVEAALVPVADDTGEERLVALAFTSLALLVEAMGEEQSWAIIPTSELERALAGSGARAVVIDPQLAEGFARG